MPRQVCVCEAQRSNESPSGAFKRQNGLRQQMEGPRPNKFADVYTSAFLAGAMRPLNVLTKFENHFVIEAVRFQVQLEADGYFSAWKVFCICSRSKQGELVPTCNFLNLIFYKSDFKNTCWASPKPDIQHKNALVPHLIDR